MKQANGFSLRLVREAEVKLVVLMAEEMKATGKNTNKTKYINELILDKFEQTQTNGEQNVKE